MTLIANHTHECTHVRFLKGATQHILRPQGRLHTNHTALLHPCGACNHVHTYMQKTETHTERPSIYWTENTLRTNTSKVTFVFTLYPLTDPLMLITAGISQHPSTHPGCYSTDLISTTTHNHTNTFRTLTQTHKTTKRANKRARAVNTLMKNSYEHNEHHY